MAEIAKDKTVCEVLKVLKVLEGSQHSQIHARVVRWHGSKRSSYDLRKFFRTDSGEFIPSGKGISLDWDFLHQVRESIDEAIEIMRKEDIKDYKPAEKA